MQRALARMGIEAPDFADLAGSLGVTPKETIHASGTLKLHHYQPLADAVCRVPVLVVTSLVNQPYILDLVPGQSMVEHLLREGFDVYLIEWGRPRREHQDLTLEDHVLRLLPECVDAVLRDCGQRELSIIGYCIGGLLSVLYAALHPQAPLKNLVCMAAPVNGDGLVLLKAWMGEGFDVEGLIEQFGNVPADWVQNTLRALRPFGKLAGAANLLNQIDRDDVVISSLRMGKWESDNIPFPGGVFRQMVNEFLRGNRLVRGTWTIGGRRVKLGDIRQPCLHLLAQDDHITPYASSCDLIRLVGSRDKTELVIKGGHVGLVAGRGAQTRMWPALVDRDRRPGRSRGRAAGLRRRHHLQRVEEAGRAHHAGPGGDHRRRRPGTDGDRGVEGDGRPRRDRHRHRSGQARSGVDGGCARRDRCEVERRGGPGTGGDPRRRPRGARPRGRHAHRLARAGQLRARRPHRDLRPDGRRHHARAAGDPDAPADDPGQLHRHAAGSARTRGADAALEDEADPGAAPAAGRGQRGDARADRRQGGRPRRTRWCHRPMGGARPSASRVRG
jgi:polyhydroxyalkanoate synthase